MILIKLPVYFRKDGLTDQEIESKIDMGYNEDEFVKEGYAYFNPEFITVINSSDRKDHCTIRYAGDDSWSIRMSVDSLIKLIGSVINLKIINANQCTK
jgi:hypothetical protein